MMTTSANTGRYRLLEQVGKGGMAEVFKAEEQLPAGQVRTVAIKRLFPRLAADRDFVRMFVNEARIASSMRHPNVVRTYDLINSGTYYYIVMEFLEGLDLEDLIAASPPGRMALNLHETVHVVQQTALGLDYAHAGGAAPGTGPVIHRDITPGNIMVDCAGRVLITDFGIARAAQYAQVTRPGILKGKYEYMAPEYVRGDKFDGRADLFSLGVVFYELLTGLNPFNAALPKDIWDRILKFDPEPPSRVSPAVPKTVDDIMRAALQKNPAKRIPSGRAFESLLARLLPERKRAQVVQSLGDRVQQVLVVRRSIAAEQGAVPGCFLPEDGPEGPAADATQEIHLDELLELVDPLDVPPPDFRKAAARRESAKQPTVRRPRRPKGRLWPWLVWIGLGISLLGGLATWFFWPPPQGFLNVKADRPTDVFVDDQRVGSTPVTELPIVAGARNIELRRVGSQQTKHYQRAIIEGEQTELRVRWVTPKPKWKKKPKRVKRNRKAKKTSKNKRKKRKRKK